MFFCELLSEGHGLLPGRLQGTCGGLEWVASRLGATFVDPNSWIRDADSGRDGLHLNRTGTRQLGDLYSRICGLDGQSQMATHN